MRTVMATMIAIVAASSVAACSSGDGVSLDQASTIAPRTTTTTTIDVANTSTSSPVPTTLTATPQEPATTAPASVPQRLRIDWEGTDAFRLGANLPWVNYGCDFGCGVNGGGASSADSSAVLEPALASARDAGMNTIRWWMFPGDPWQITRDEEELPTDIDPSVFQDLDAALALAEQYDLDFVFTLFSGPRDLPAAWLNTPEGRERLAAALAPLFARYADNPRIMTWQIMNEPEWDIWNGEVGRENVRQLVRAVADSVHASSSTLVSVGGARLDGLETWVGLGLDYFTVHWYDPMTAPEQCARCVSSAEVAASYGIDAPVMIGELYLGPDVDVLQRLVDFEALGYAGALGWSLLPDRTADRLAIDLTAVADFSPPAR